MYAYLNWSGLRPMTELEYEKSCRGERAAFANEMAWGDTTYVYQTGIDGLDLSGTETDYSPWRSRNHSLGFRGVRTAP